MMVRAPYYEERKVIINSKFYDNPAIFGNNHRADINKQRMRGKLNKNNKVKKKQCPICKKLMPVYHINIHGQEIYMCPEHGKMELE